MGDVILVVVGSYLSVGALCGVIALVQSWADMGEERRMPDLADVGWWGFAFLLMLIAWPVLLEELI